MSQKYFQNNKVLNFFIGKILISGISGVLISICYTIWIIKLSKHLIKSIKLYTENKTKDFRDRRERSRYLYNYETHIIKDIILIIISLGEISEPIFAIVCGAFISVYTGSNDSPSYPQFNATEQCTFTQTAVQVQSQLNSILFPKSWITYIITLMLLGIVSYIILLSFLTQYLAKRYFLHSLRGTCVGYLALIMTQFTIIFFVTNRDITILLLILAPALVLFDWYILVRSSKKLYCVLKSNVRDLKLHISQRYLYREQLKLLQIYKIFMPILLTAIFFGVCALFSHFYCYIGISLFWSKCFNSAIGYPSKLNSDTLPLKFIYYLDSFSEYSSLILLTTHFILLSLPILSISIGMLVSNCAKRFCYQRNEKNYRFNHQNCSKALIRNNLTPLYTK